MFNDETVLQQDNVIFYSLRIIIERRVLIFVQNSLTNELLLTELFDKYNIETSDKMNDNHIEK